LEGITGGRVEFEAGDEYGVEALGVETGNVEILDKGILGIEQLVVEMLDVEVLHVEILGIDMLTGEELGGEYDGKLDEWLSLSENQDDELWIQPGVKVLDSHCADPSVSAQDVSGSPP
jgi:hypothetical protein